MPATVTVTTIKLNRLAAGLTEPAAKLIALKKIGAIYRSFASQRFSRLSRGGGEWPGLAKSTISRRRKGKGSTQKASILIDKGLLFAALAPVAGVGQGALEAVTTRGVRLGYGGPMKYPNGNGVTLADIASFHQSGTDRLPQRKIIVEPDTATLQLMTKHINTWLATRSS